MSIVTIGYTGSASNQGSYPVNTLVYPDGKIIYRVESGLVRMEVKQMQSFLVGTKFQISGIDFKEDRLELKLTIPNHDEGRLKMMLGAGWQNQMTNDAVITLISKFLSLPPAPTVHSAARTAPASSVPSASQIPDKSLPLTAPDSAQRAGAPSNGDGRKRETAPALQTTSSQGFVTDNCAASKIATQSDDPATKNHEAGVSGVAAVGVARLASMTSAMRPFAGRISSGDLHLLFDASKDPLDNDIANGTDVFHKNFIGSDGRLQEVDQLTLDCRQVLAYPTRYDSPVMRAARPHCEEHQKAKADEVQAKLQAIAANCKAARQTVLRVEDALDHSDWLTAANGDSELASTICWVGKAYLAKNQTLSSDLLSARIYNEGTNTLFLKSDSSFSSRLSRVARDETVIERLGCHVEPQGRPFVALVQDAIIALGNELDQWPGQPCNECLAATSLSEASAADRSRKSVELSTQITFVRAHLDGMRYLADEHAQTGDVGQVFGAEGTLVFDAKMQAAEDDRENLGHLEGSRDRLAQHEQAIESEHTLLAKSGSTLTRYRGIFIGELLDERAVKQSGCPLGLPTAAITAILKDGSPEACSLTGGYQVDQIFDFVRGSERQVYASLTARYGNPAPGRYRMIGTEAVPEWLLWKNQDGTLIAARPDQGNYRDQNSIFFVDIMVFKR
jgi:hypothetical protein